MARCMYCGSELPEGARHCTNCGAPQQIPLNGTSAGYAPPPPVNVAEMPVYGENPVNYVGGGYQPPHYAAPDPAMHTTSMGMWFLWCLIMMWMPVIGPVILLCTAKDPSAKNCAKAMLIFHGIGAALYLLFAASFGSALR